MAQSSSSAERPRIDHAVYPAFTQRKSRAVSLSDERLWLSKNSILEKCSEQLFARMPYHRLSQFLAFSIRQISAAQDCSEEELRAVWAIRTAARPLDRLAWRGARECSMPRPRPA